MSQTKILFVDDNPHVVVLAVDQLQFLGYQVEVARDGKEALDKVDESRPDLIVLDIMMPKIDGYEVCRRLKSAIGTRDIPILMLSAKGQIQDKVMGLDVGADDYLPKPYDLDELKARIEALLRRYASAPYKVTDIKYSISLLCRPEHPISVHVKGGLTFTDVSRGNLDLDSHEFGRLADETAQASWRFRSKDTGKRLFEKVFVDHPTIQRAYVETRGNSKHEEDVSIRIESSRALFRVPFEFMFNSLGSDGDYLVLRHPLYRSISGIGVRRLPVSASMLNEACVRNEPLRILLIASNTVPEIPGVDEEIETLANAIPMIFAGKQIKTYLKVLQTETATYDTVCAELEKCRYHILHYAGHGSYNCDSPEQSSLSFWERPNGQGRCIALPVSELQNLLRDSDLRFVYLSCCRGAQSGNDESLLDDDLLGISDGMLLAGVPAVLAYRWAVTDASATELAFAFYRSLAEQGELDVALLHARREIAGRQRDDITWLSPVLILQA